MDKKFSILICSLAERKALLDRLLANLERQRVPAVEVLTAVDNGELSIGRKRQELLERAAGEYVAFVDDDDMVSPRYVARVLHAAATGPDVIGLKGMYYKNSVKQKPFIHTTASKGWHETPEAYWRTPNHLNPVRREHALAIGFVDMNHGEDKEYSDRIHASGLLQREVMIPEIIYEYWYNERTSRSKK